MKRFDLAKYLSTMNDSDLIRKIIDFKIPWPNVCDRKTKEECNKMGYLINDRWCIEDGRNKPKWRFRIWEDGRKTLDLLDPETDCFITRLFVIDKEGYINILTTALNKIHEYNLEEIPGGLLKLRQK